MFTAHITWTRKGYHKSQHWQRVGGETVHADSRDELVQELIEKYGAGPWKRKRPMYRDRLNGTSYKCGYVVGFRVVDQDRSAADGCYRCLEQDWISFTEDHSKPVLL